MPSKRQRNGHVQWLAQINRKNFRKEQICKSKKEALLWEQQVKSLLTSGISPRDVLRLLDVGVPPEQIPIALEKEKTHTVSLLEWSSGYLDHAQMTVSRGSYREKRSIMRRFLLWHGKPNASVETLTVGTIYDYLQLQAKKRSGNAANKDRTHLGAAWNWGIKYEKCPLPNPFFKIDKFPHDKSHHYMPPMEDFLKVVSMASQQDKVLLWTYYYTAGRRQEILNLRWDDIDFRQQRLRLFTRKRKGGNLEADWVDMTDELAALLLEHRKESVNSWVFVKRTKGVGYLKPFKTGRKKWPKNLCRITKVKPFGCHGIRALTASTLARGDVPMVAIKQHLRHKHLMTTEDYVRGVASIRPHLKVLTGGKTQAENAA